MRLTARVPGNNQPFNVLDETYVERETIENAVRIEFYDVNGSPVSYGGSSSGNNNSKATQTTVRMNGTTILQRAGSPADRRETEHLLPAGDHGFRYGRPGPGSGRQLPGDGCQHRSFGDQAMGVVRRYLEQRQGLAQDVADAIGDNQEFAKSGPWLWKWPGWMALWLRAAVPI